MVLCRFLFLKMFFGWYVTSSKTKNGRRLSFLMCAGSKYSSKEEVNGILKKPPLDSGSEGRFLSVF